MDYRAGGERQLPSSFVQNTIKVAMPEIHDKINNLINWYIKKNFAGLANCSSLSIGPDIYSGDKFTPDYFGIGLGRREEQKEIAATMGTFHVYVELSGTLDKVPFLWFYNANSRLNVHVVLLDLYDWNPGDKVPYPPYLWSTNYIRDDWANNLEKHGHARSYINRGDYTYTDAQNGVGGPGWFFDPNNPPRPWGSVSCIGSGLEMPNGNKDYCGKKLH